MNSAIERLLTLRVSDVMSRNVVSVAASNTMVEAAGVLTQNFISGVPVIGHDGHCAGILSATDFVRCVAEVAGEGPASPERSEQRPAPGANHHACRVPATDTVASHMSALLQTISADRPLTEAARMMCRNHIHRLLVLDGGRPTGVITALDIVSALINAIEE